MSSSAESSDKTIKLWKVFDKQIKVVAENNHSDGFPSAGANGALPNLRLPRMTTHDSITAAVPRKVYANAHAYHINSISVNSDGETYISADDLRVNLWNLNISDQSFSEYFVWRRLLIDIVDIKPVNMEELTEVITAAEFHPISCNLFMYSSSKGTIKLADMRESALCDQHAKRESEQPHQLTEQCSRRKKIRPRNRSSRKSFRQSRMSSFQKMADLSYHATTLR
jgi:serine/threonine-protein phosphatase 2A regulatory subunit B